jgi:hypothetical protein
MRHFALTLVTLTTLAACGGGGGSVASPTAADLTGTWRGTWSSILMKPTSFRMGLQQLETGFNGEFASGDGAYGLVTGTNLNGAVTITISKNNPTCTGTFTGTGTISNGILSFTFTGSDCSGAHANGLADLTLQ